MAEWYGGQTRGMAGETRELATALVVATLVMALLAVAALVIAG